MLDLGYLSAVWALEVVSSEEADLNINMRCIDFMDSVANSSDKEKANKTVKKSLTSYLRFSGIFNSLLNKKSWYRGK